MLDKKQTAVDWLWDILTTSFWEYKTFEEQKEIIEQAKEMEKEQIQQAWIAGMRSVSIAPFEDEFYQDEAERYYENR